MLPPAGRTNDRHALGHDPLQNTVTPTPHGDGFSIVLRNRALRQ
jgi:hypothetical protein